MLLTHPILQKPKRGALEEEEEWLHSDFIVFPLDLQSTTPREPLWAYVFFQWGKRAYVGQPAPPVL